jgi:hypothetical protein
MIKAGSGMRGMQRTDRVFLFWRELAIYGRDKRMPYVGIAVKRDYYRL